MREGAPHDKGADRARLTRGGAPPKERPNEGNTVRIQARLAEEICACFTSAFAS